MREVREAISRGEDNVFFVEFLKEFYGEEEVPQWVRDAAEYMGYDIDWPKCDET